jgi:type-F conjugative transfer system protein TrbI
MKLFKCNLSMPLGMMGRALLIIVGTVLFCMCLQEYTKNNSTVALVNINAIVNRYIHSMAKSKLDEPTLQKNTALFMKKLEEELSRLAEEKKIGLLVSEAIIAGGTDYTADIETRVYRAYQEEIEKK